MSELSPLELLHGAQSDAPPVTALNLPPDELLATAVRESLAAAAKAKLLPPPDPVFDSSVPPHDELVSIIDRLLPEGKIDETL